MDPGCIRIPWKLARLSRGKRDVDWPRLHIFIRLKINFRRSTHRAREEEVGL
jgi:hypothetical protein